MIIFPAIDLRVGRVVRLKQGRPDAETVYGDDPVQVALKWQAEGAEWLHVVNLDGAFGENAQPNLEAIERVARAVAIPVELGGGLRDEANLRSAFALGVARVIVGTVAVQNPSLVSDLVREFGPERIVAGIDGRDGRVATHGWQQVSDISATDLARQMAARGIHRVVYTDISRDGMLQGIDAQAMANLAQASGLRVIASGGVATLQDVRRLAEREKDGVEGVIIGQALYTGAIALKEAIDVGKTHYSVS